MRARLKLLPDWPARPRVLLIALIVVLAALCSLWPLYKTLEAVAFFALTSFVLLLAAAFGGLIRLWYVQKKLFAAVFDTAHEAVAIADGKGRIIYHNRQLEKNWGAPKKGERLYTHLSFMFTESVRQEIEDRLASDPTWSGTLTYPREEDELEGVAEVRITKTDEGYRAVTMRDMSARRQAEKDNRMLQQQVYQAQKLEALGRLAGGIAHDFNNVLAAIMGYTEFLIEDLDPDTPQHRFARGIIQSGTQAHTLIEQILTFSRRSEQPHRALDVVSVLHETLDMLESGMPKNIALHTQITPEHAYVYAGHVQLIQLFMNICVNARDAVDNSNGEIAVSLAMLDHTDSRFSDMLSERPVDEHEAATPDIAIQHPDTGRTRLLLGHIIRDRAYIHVSIQDNGNGMPASVMERIFDPFFTTKDADSGTGLGMSIIHGIVSDIGAAMTIDSIQDSGTRFDIFLPECAPPSRDQQEAIRPYDADRLYDELDGEIIIIDDDDNVRIMLGHMLERRNIPVKSFTGAVDGLAYIQSRGDAVACVITDYNMPELTGLDLIEKLEEDYPLLPFIIITGYHADELAHAMQNYPGLCAILHKPLQTEELISTIQRVVWPPEEEKPGVNRAAPPRAAMRP